MFPKSVFVLFLISQSHVFALCTFLLARDLLMLVVAKPGEAPNHHTMYGAGWGGVRGGGARHSLRRLHDMSGDRFKLRYHAELHPQVQDGRHLASTRHLCTGMRGSNPEPLPCMQLFTPLRGIPICPAQVGRRRLLG